ncbi:immune inhibitor A domain-containing protein [Nocardioides sp. CER19]|uniref:immune inhibitor A domain-containing protein n=1 Tax=Nocardioides sp. CER19 TaxID=3038538 RepID=UPI002447033C|nr:immune inhibitor A domain-containing protein [Nocardioides sp. CER19]MDH2414689.1 immune inhibitor A [Nocardioides sp. CER19]
MSAAAVLGLAAATVPGGAHATPSPAHVKALKTDAGAATRSDDRPSPLEQKRRAAKKIAAEKLASGKAKTVTKNGSKVVDIGDGDWVEYQTEETQQLLTFLVDFGDTNTNTAFPANASGPVHDQIPQPDRAKDNSTYWKQHFDRQHYLDMFFNGMPDQNNESFKGVYKEMSSGRFDLEGDVSDWVTVPKTEASYQDAKGNETGMDDFLADSGNAWYDAQVKAGKTDADIAAYLDQFDQWDRYDLDGDGNYNEPDGYIDHFQAIHAGTGEEDGSPAWAIWSHRSATNVNGYGVDGPAVGSCAACAPIGGVEIGHTGKWIYDYTTEPENGGLGVFAHEFGHDLGLPDYYDTATDTAPDDNSVDFWSLMSAGSWLSHGVKDSPGAGTTPNHMDAVSKFLLGWLDYKKVDPFQTASIDLGPSYHASTLPQAAVVDLPDGDAFVTTGTGYAGSKGYLYSGRGDDWRTSAIQSPSFTVPAAAQLTAQVAYNIEQDWDYAYVEISTDGGTTWKKVHTNLSTSDDPNEQNEGEGITGYSNPNIAGNLTGQPPTTWVKLVADLGAYAGQTAQIRFKHVNDAAYNDFGLKVDNVAVGSALSTNFENGFAGWTQGTADEFYTITGTGYDVSFPRFYVAENRVYGGYDQTLEQGPYNRGWPVSKPNYLENFPFQDGLLVWYVNGLYDNNNTSAHPGGGLALPVDAHPTALRWSTRDAARSRIQTFDSTFGLASTTPLNLHSEYKDTKGRLHAVTLTSPARPGVATFDDSVPSAYYDAAKPDSSVKVAGTGTTIRVVANNESTGRMTIQVAPVAPRPVTKLTISPAPRVGMRLHVAGAWTQSPSLKYQWYANGSPIAGATGATFTPPMALLGKVLTVRVTATTAEHPTGTATTAAARVLPAAVGLSVKANRTVRPHKKAKVTVIVSSPGLAPAGRVTVRFSGKKVTKALSGGRASFKMPARSKGKKKLVVVYTPSTGYSSATKTVIIKVK